MAITNYGDGSELDAFEDLPVNSTIESSFLKQPKAVVKPPRTRRPDIDELIAIDRLPVSLTAEARYLKVPSTTKACLDTPNVLSSADVRRINVQSSCGNMVSDGESTMIRTQDSLKATISKGTLIIKDLNKAPMPANKTMSSESAVDERITSIAPEQLVLRLPRELRDEIYKHLLCKVYLVELPAVGDAALRCGYCANTAYELAWQPPLFPRFALPLPTLLGPEDIRAPWVTDMKESRQIEEARYNLAQKQRWNLTVPEQHLAILRVSSATYAETFPLLYAKSTFCFFISEPRKDGLNKSIAGLMKNIDIHIDLSRAFERNESLVEQACTLEFARRLLHKFGGSLAKRKLCIIRIDYPDDNEFLTQPSFVRAIGSLTGFETVALRFTPAFMTEEIRRLYSATAYNAVFRAQVKQRHKRQVARLERLEVDLKKSLGPSRIEYTREDFLALVFHPQRQPTGSPAPEFDVEELADPKISCRLSAAWNTYRSYRMGR